MVLQKNCFFAYFLLIFTLVSHASQEQDAYKELQKELEERKKNNFSFSIDVRTLLEKEDKDNNCLETEDACNSFKELQRMERIYKILPFVRKQRIEIVQKNLSNSLLDCIVQEILQYDECFEDPYCNGRIENELKPITFTLYSTPSAFFHSDNCSVEYDTEYGIYKESPVIVIATIVSQLEEDEKNIHRMLKAIIGRGLWEE